MSSSISLGKVDQGALPTDKEKFFSLYHASLADDLKKKLQFRDEGNGVWCGFEEVTAPEISVRDLQQFLKDAGFMPKSNVDGIFGYATQAATRLFQEYMRTVENDPSIGTPDGIVGRNTVKHIEKWKRDKAGSPHFVSEWGRSNAQNPSEEFKQWLALLSKAKEHYMAHPSPILSHIDNYGKPTDTKKISEWDVSPNIIHLVGIRREQESRDLRRENDDLFVLLINGIVFKFWGSTDPNRRIADRSDIPFLIEGQHEYQFGWHKVGDQKTVYRALRPASSGVLVFRDKNADRALTDDDIVKGLDAAPNTTINIHWSGVGSTNFSAGCQVMAGKSYINHKNNLVDCSGFAAASYDQLGGQKTRGAYNVFADLVLTYAPPDIHTLRYTLGRDDTFFLSDIWNADFVKETVEKMKGRI